MYTEGMQSTLPDTFLLYILTMYYFLPSHFWCIWNKIFPFTLIYFIFNYIFILLSFFTEYDNIKNLLNINLICLL